MSKEELKEGREKFWRMLTVNTALMIASSRSLGKFTWYFLVPISLCIVGLIVNTSWFTNWYIGDDEDDDTDE